MKYPIFFWCCSCKLTQCPAESLRKQLHSGTRGAYLKWGDIERYSGEFQKYPKNYFQNMPSESDLLCSYILQAWSRPGQYLKGTVFCPDGLPKFHVHTNLCPVQYVSALDLTFGLTELYDWNIPHFIDIWHLLTVIAKTRTMHLFTSDFLSIYKNGIRSSSTMKLYMNIYICLLFFLATTSACAYPPRIPPYSTFSECYNKHLRETIKWAERQKCVWSKVRCYWHSATFRNPSHDDSSISESFWYYM